MCCLLLLCVFVGAVLRWLGASARCRADFCFLTRLVRRRRVLWRQPNECTHVSTSQRAHQRRARVQNRAGRARRRRQRYGPHCTASATAGRRCAALRAARLLSTQQSPPGAVWLLATVVGALCVCVCVCVCVRVCRARVCLCGDDDDGRRSQRREQSWRRFARRSRKTKATIDSATWPS